MKLDDRLALDTATRRLFLNFENLRLRTRADIEEIRDAVEQRVKPLSERVDVIVNYNRFDLPSELEADYADMVQALEHTYYGAVSRNISNAFMRLKLGLSLTRALPPHVFESAEVARRFLIEKH